MDQITTAKKLQSWRFECMLAPCESSKCQLCRVPGPVLQFLILRALTFKARNFSPLPITTHLILNFQSGKQLFSTRKPSFKDNFCGYLYGLDKTAIYRLLVFFFFIIIVCCFC